jgi:arylsulfatase A-like enzyme
MNATRSIAIVGLLIANSATAGSAAEPQRPNVLFIAVDDLRDWLGYMETNPQTKTPNIDRLASRGVYFTRGYCAAPVCNGSRAALMSGLRPSTTGVYENNADWRPVISEDKPLTAAFRRAGYYLVGAGKIYHGGFDRRSEFDDYFSERHRDPQPTGDVGVGGIRFAPLDCKDEDLADYHITSYCIEQLGKKHDKPFFLACGLHKPHMPWNVPQKYYDMFPLESIQLPTVTHNDLEDVPPAGVRMARPEGDHAAILQSERWKDAVQGYLAAIAYTDMNVGRLLDALDKSAYRDNTIICFWGDHGWHLGEKEHWRKFALWEEATRSPLIWVVPGAKPGRCDRPVDFMSIYPTLMDLCGIECPQHVEGVSIRPLLADPSAAWDRPALTTYHKSNHAIRTDKWRFIRYANGDEELYDETADPHEWKNLADKPEHAAVKKELASHFPTMNHEELGGAGDKAKGKGKGKAKAKLKAEKAE